MGLYSLDYLMAVFLDNFEEVEVDDWKHNLSQIAIKIKEFAFHKDFNDFRESLERFDLNNKYIWNGVDLDLFNLNDEELVSNELAELLPYNCKPQPVFNMPKQIVIREKFSEDLIFFHFEKRLFQKLKNWPQQFSFLVVHEWLWSYFSSDNLEGLRKANSFLHSTEFFLLSHDEIAKKLESFGFDL